MFDTKDDDEVDEEGSDGEAVVAEREEKRIIESTSGAGLSSSGKGSGTEESEEKGTGKRKRKGKKRSRAEKERASKKWGSGINGKEGTEEDAGR